MTSSALRRFVSSALAVLGTHIALSAHALPLDLSALPAGEASQPPTRRSAPTAIGAAQQAPGIHRLTPDRAFHPRIPGFHEAMFFDVEEQAREFEAARAKGEEAPFRRNDSCFATPGTFRIPEENDSRNLDWDTFSTGHFTAQTYTGDTSRKVIPVRAERLIESNGSVHLESTQFWVDLRNGGTRLIRRTSTELALVASPQAGVAVYAQRTGPDAVSFFVRREIQQPAAPSLNSAVLLRQTFGPQNALGIDLAMLRTTLSEEVRPSECTFQRVDLSVRPDPIVAANAAAIPRPEPAGPRRNQSVRAPFRTDRSAEIANVAFGLVLDVKLEPPPSKAAADDAPRAAAPRGTVTTRIMVVNLGISRPSAEAAAVPSVSYGWLDRTRTKPF